MSEPQPPPPNGKKAYFWPVALNLGLLLLVAVLSEAEPAVMAGAVLALAIVNGVAAFVMSVSGKIDYVVAFLLSGLVIFLIGLGICGLMLSGLGSMH